MDTVVEINVIGQVINLGPLDRLFVRKLSRTGSSVGLLIQICEWQFMQVFVGGITAQSEFSTDVWQ